MLLSLGKVPTGSCLSRSCFKISDWVSITYSLGVFQAVLFCDESKEDWIFIWAHLEWDLHYLQFLIHLVLISTDFQIRHCGSLSSWCQLPGSRRLIWGTTPPICIWRFSLTVEWCGVLDEVMSLPSYPFQDASFVFCCGSAALGSFSEKNYSICRCKFLMSVGGGKFRMFPHYHVELFPSPILYKCHSVCPETVPIAHWSLRSQLNSDTKPTQYCKAIILWLKINRSHTSQSLMFKISLNLPA